MATRPTHRHPEDRTSPGPPSCQCRGSITPVREAAESGRRYPPRFVASALDLWAKIFGRPRSWEPLVPQVSASVSTLSPPCPPRRRGSSADGEVCSGVRLQASFSRGLDPRLRGERGPEGPLPGLWVWLTGVSMRPSLSLRRSPLELVHWTNSSATRTARSRFDGRAAELRCSP